jgi:hypothetical protein
MSKVCLNALALAALLVSNALAASPPLNVDATGCLEVLKSGPAESCKTKDSVNVEMINSCAYPVRAQLCLRGPDHLWVACEAAPSLSPMQHLTKTACASDGAYTYWGCSKFSKTSGKCGGENLVGKATNIAK